MKIVAKIDELTNRVTSVKLTATSFEEEKFLKVVNNAFERGGKIVANDGETKIKWITKLKDK